MQVRLFSGIFDPGTESALELEVNNWFNQETEATLLNMAVNMTQREGKMAVLITVLYDYGVEDIVNDIPDVGELLQTIGPRRR